VHTGQHYDPSMSELMFRTLRLPQPHHVLGVGSGSHAYQISRIMERLEPVLLKEKADCVLVYGDTNSTLAGALTAAGLGIPVAHVEAGLRSYNRTMPEEVNRVIVDHIADFLFCPTKVSVSNLRNEGIRRGVYRVGDVMLDSALFWRQTAASRKVPQALGLERKGYLLMTLHRPGNVDDAKSLGRVLGAIRRLDRIVVFPIHPRTRARLRRTLGAAKPPANLRIVEPMVYFDFLSALMNAEKVLTDSGGVQKQAYFFGVPCITLREETEWIETVQAGWNVLVGTKPTSIVEAAENFSPSGGRPNFYGAGRAAPSIVKVMENRLGG